MHQSTNSNSLCQALLDFNQAAEESVSFWNSFDNPDRHGSYGETLPINEVNHSLQNQHVIESSLRNMRYISPSTSMTKLENSTTCDASGVVPTINHFNHSTIGSNNSKPLNEKDDVTSYKPTNEISPKISHKSAAVVTVNTASTTKANANLRQKKPRITRKWEQHTGGNRFFCNGRIIVSRQCSILFLTIFLITLTMTLFCVFDLPFLTERVSIALPFVVGSLFLLVMSSLFKTSFSDPGILPRAPLREVIEWERQARSNSTEWTPPRTKIIQVAGQNVKLKYCFTCCLFRPPRSSHCSICDNCILNFDHHCPWVGNCVGLRNYRHFYFFISFLSVLDSFIGVCVTAHLIILSNEKGTFLTAVKESPTSIFTAFVTLISVWSIVGLSGFHTYLIAINQTTNEDIKGTFSSKNRPSIRNPYSSTNFFKNIFHTLFVFEPPSLLDKRGIVEEDKIITLQEETLRSFAFKFSSLYDNVNSGITDCDEDSKCASNAMDTWALQPTENLRESSQRNSAHLRNAVAPTSSSLTFTPLKMMPQSPGRNAAECATNTAVGCGVPVSSSTNRSKRGIIPSYSSADDPS